MMPPLKTIPHRVAVVAATVAAVLAVAALVVWAVAAIPRLQVRGVVIESPDASAKTAALINENRRTLVQAIGGVFVVVGALSGAYFTWQQITVTREGQITDRFTKAIVQLGDEKLEVRLGGIYALKRIARDSPKDQWTIVETLAAFIRQHAPAPAKTPDAAAASPRDVSTLPRLRTDIQAALTVLARRNQIREPEVIDLSQTDLAFADLKDAYLEGAVLSGAHLERAWLEAAHLKGARLIDAHLAGR
jgi:hypothetical protein